MSDLTLSTRSSRGLTVIGVSGELDLANEHCLEATVLQAMGTHAVVVDLSDVDFLAISSLGVLVRLEMAARDAAVPLAFATASDAVRKLLRVSGLDSELRLFPTPAAACEAVRGRTLSDRRGRDLPTR